MKHIEENAARTCAEILKSTATMQEIVAAAAQRTQTGVQQPLVFYSNERIAMAIQERALYIRSLVALLNDAHSKVAERNQLIVEEIRKSRLDEFERTFVPTLGAVPGIGDFTEICEICTDNALHNDNTWQMRCCANKICSHCFFRHSFQTAAVNDTAGCPFCRAAYDIYYKNR
jgi:hypothetical protein